MTEETAKLAALLRAGKTDAFHEAVQGGAPRTLAGETFKEVSGGGFDLRGFDLSNTEWTDCLFSSVEFVESNLDGAYFDGSTLVDCDFAKCTGDGLAVDGGVIKGANFSECSLPASEWTGVELEDCTFDGASLEGVVMEAVTVSGGRFGDVNIGEASLTNVVFRDVVAHGFDTSKAEVAGCTSNSEPLPTGFVPLTGRRTRIT